VERSGSRHNEVFRAAITGPSYLLVDAPKGVGNIVQGLEIAEELAGRGAQLARSRHSAGPSVL